jgi:hypothetical protein
MQTSFKGMKMYKWETADQFENKFINTFKNERGSIHFDWDVHALSQE